MRRILTLTLNPALDLTTAVDEVTPQDKLRCDAPVAQPGGGGVNVARAIRRLGGSALAIHTCGGEAGSRLVGMLDEEGVEQRPIRIEAATRESLTVAERATGRRFRFVFPGPKLKRGEWESCLEAVEELSGEETIVVASGSLPPGAPDDLYAQLGRAARERGARVFLDTSGRALQAALEYGVHLAKPDLRELQQLAGAELATEEERVRAVTDMVADGGAEIMVATLQDEGALVATAQGHEFIRPPDIEREASAVGAGDSFMAALTLALARCDDIVDAARFGVAASAAALLTPGSELCRRDDAERLYAQIAPS